MGRDWWASLARAQLLPVAANRLAQVRWWAELLAAGMRGVLRQAVVMPWAVELLPAAGRRAAEGLLLRAAPWLAAAVQQLQWA